MRGSCREQGLVPGQSREGIPATCQWVPLQKGGCGSGFILMELSPGGICPTWIQSCRVRCGDPKAQPRHPPHPGFLVPHGMWMPHAPWQASPIRNGVKYSSAPRLQPGASPGLEKIQAPSGRGRQAGCDPLRSRGGCLLPPFWRFRRLRDAVSLLLGPASSRMAQEKILQPGKCC